MGLEEVPTWIFKVTFLISSVSKRSRVWEPGKGHELKKGGLYAVLRG